MLAPLRTEDTFPEIHAYPATIGDVTYLTEPGVSCLAATNTARHMLAEFLNGFDPALEFSDYCHDPDRGSLSEAAHISMIAGQLCYLSFGPKRSTCAESNTYLANIKGSGHGSVLEHGSATLLFYGISRSCTHELVRHRIGMSFSQVSQRYVDGTKLRFVERPEYQYESTLHHDFVIRIQDAKRTYEKEADRLHQLWSHVPSFQALTRTEKRKAVNQVARSVLPNETEAPIVVTGNMRAWRHFLEQRGSAYAEPEIRNLAYNAYRVLAHLAPEIFDDYTVRELPDVGAGITYALDTPWHKV